MIDRFYIIDFIHFFSSERYEAQYDAGNCTYLRINDAAVTKGVTDSLDHITTTLLVS